MAQLPITGNVRGRQTYTNDGGGYSSQQSAQKRAQPSQDYINRTNQMVANYKAKVANNTPSYSYGGGGSSAQEVPSYSGGGSVDTSTSYNDEYINKIKNLISEQEKAGKEYYNKLHAQELAKNLSDYQNMVNAINVNDARTMRFMKSMYGNDVSGAGLSNQVRLKSNTNNKLAEANLNKTNNDYASDARLNQNLSNLASLMAQSYNNYVVPTYERRQQFNDSLANDLKKYMLTMQWNNM